MSTEKELKAEITRLKAENETLKLGCLLTPIDVLLFIKMKDEVDRLRKAGDLLAFHYVSLGKKFFPEDPLPYSIENWNAAKEGKPTK